LTAAANSPETQFDPGESVLLEPNINFVGTKSNNLQVIMPAGILTGVLDTFTYVVMVIQGILAQNVTLMS
jgi:cellobiose-specific phosphotransferase system component IIB